MAGELEGIVEACAVASPVLSMSNTNHIILEISRLGRLNFVVEELGGFFCVGVGPVTDDVGTVNFILVDCLSTVGHWLDFGLVISCANLLLLKLALLAGLALKTG